MEMGLENASLTLTLTLTLTLELLALANCCYSCDFYPFCGCINFEAVKNKNDISFSAEMELNVDIATAL